MSTKEKAAQQHNVSWKSELKKISIMLAVIWFLRSSVLGFYIIPTGSMLPTININDHIITNKLAYGLMLPLTDKQIISWAKPQRGDIVLFEHRMENTGESMTFVKRVVGLEGDTISFQKGVLTINGTAVKEELQTDRTPLDDMGEPAEGKVLYLEHGASPQPHYILKAENDGPTFFEVRQWQIPEGKLMVMGDARDYSHDSRKWGFVDIQKIYGRSSRIFYSIRGWQGPLPLFRSDRFFKPIN